ncbi:MAG: NEW3 domain-containing protein [archaeon]
MAEEKEVRGHLKEGQIQLIAIIFLLFVPVVTAAIYNMTSLKDSSPISGNTIWQENSSLDEFIEKSISEKQEINSTDNEQTDFSEENFSAPLNESMPQEDFVMPINETTSSNNSLPELEKGKEEGNDRMPLLVISISPLQKITRGSSENITAVISNNGNAKAKKVIADWNIPVGFEIVNGNEREELGDIKEGESRTMEIEVTPLLDAELGNTKITIGANYE